MSEPATRMATADAPALRSGPTASVYTLIGPGLLVAAAGLGAGDIVSATMAASSHGLVLLWAVALAAFLKFVLNEGIARWQLATETTAVEAWLTHLPWWVRVYFVVYLVLWTVSVSAALTSACGLGLATLTGGAVPRPVGAIGHSLAGGLVALAGGYAGFEKVMKALIATMFFAIIACAALTIDDPAGVVRGLVTPVVPAGGATTVLSVLGGIGGSIAMLAYNYWMREEGMRGASWLRFVRADIAIAYVFTALIGMAIMVVANQAFHVPGVAITNAQAVSRMADMLATLIGPLGFYAFAVGFWAAVFASLLGVWQSIPYLFADCYGLLRGLSPDVHARVIQVTSTPYRAALAFITLVPLPLAFIDQPLFMIRTFTIVGSLFIPFVAATLLYMNNALIPADSGVPRNSRTTNAVLALALVVFGVVGLSELGLL
ncbi:MAG: Nramp family divalent metal transporter [Acidobacteriota bacterium]